MTTQKWIGEVATAPFSVMSVVERTAGPMEGRRRKMKGRRLRSARCRGRYGNEGSAVGLAFEHDMAFHGGEDGMVTAHADPCARVPFRAPLPRDDVAGNNYFAAEFLDAQATPRCVAPVS